MSQLKQTACGKCVGFIPYYIETEDSFIKMSFGHCILKGSGGYLKTLSKPCNMFQAKIKRRAAGRVSLKIKDLQT